MAELFSNVVFWLGVLLGAWVIVAVRAASQARKGYQGAKANLPNLRKTARGATMRATGRVLVLALVALILAIVCFLGNFWNTGG